MIHHKPSEAPPFEGTIGLFPEDDQEFLAAGPEFSGVLSMLAKVPDLGTEEVGSEGGA